MSLLLGKCCCRESPIEVDKELDKAVPSNILLYEHDPPLYDPSQGDPLFTARADPNVVGAGLSVYHNERRDSERSETPLHPDSFAPPLEDHPAFKEASQHSLKDDSSHEDNKKQKVPSNGHEDPLPEEPSPAPETTEPTPVESTSVTTKPKPKAKRKPKPVESAPPPTNEVPIETNAKESPVEEANDKVYGHPGKILQMRLETGWEDFDDDDMKQINNNLRIGAEFFSMTKEGQMYMCDFRDIKNITQINPNTRKVRNLRLVDESRKYDDTHGTGSNEEVILTFFPGPIGLVHLPDGSIDEVLPGSQGEREGVKVGWKVIAVNQTTCTGFDQKPFLDARNGEKAYTLTFVKEDGSLSSGEDGHGRSSQQPKCCVIS